MTGATTATLRRELLTDPQQFAALAPDWDRCADATAPSPYLTSAWLIAWWKARGPDARCLLLRDSDGRLRAGALVRQRRLSLQGAADVDSGDWGVVGTDEAARQAAWSHLAILARPSGRLVLPALDPEALSSARRALEPGGYRVTTLAHLHSPVLPLPAAYADLLAAVSRNLRSQLGRARRALERDGRLVLRTTRKDVEVERDLDSFLRLEAAGWKGRSGTAILSTSRTHRLYRDFARSAFLSGCLRLLFLELDGVPLAADLSYRRGSRLSLVKTAYDERYATRRPGLVLRGMALESALAEGCREYDFLGAPDTYKTRWGGGLRPRTTVLAVRGVYRLESVAREAARPHLGRFTRRTTAFLGRTTGTPVSAGPRV